MREKIFKSLSVLMSLILFVSVISFPGINVNAKGPVDDFVERCYQVVLGRESDAGGKQYWTDRLTKEDAQDGRATGGFCAYSFLVSPEFLNKSCTNEQFVESLYTMFMNRGSDADGLAYWCGRLESGEVDRLGVIAGFINSEEFFKICDTAGITAGSFPIDNPTQEQVAQMNQVNLFVDRMYEKCMGRRGDYGGQYYWLSKLLSKEITGVDCAKFFVSSQEFADKNLSNDGYVEVLYRVFMGREYDDAGKAYWLERLENGMTRDEVFEGFAMSPEFGQICSNYGINRGNYLAKDKGTFWVYQAMISLKDEYPEGMEWTNDNRYKNGLGCAGFAFLLSDTAFGDAPHNWINKPTFDEICVGDILRINDNTHSVVVLKKFENGIEIAEGNYGGTIHWGRTISREKLENGRIDYIETRYNSEEREKIKNLYSQNSNSNNPLHVHAFDNKIADKNYLKSEATCKESAIYYMSCECGEFDQNLTFSSGKPTNHKYENKVKDNFKYLKNSATCTEPATYYMSCVWCGEADYEHTFSSGKALGHKWDAGTVTLLPTLDEDGVKTYHCLSGCNEIKTETIPKIALSNLKEGDIVGFGEYEQDGNNQNGKEVIEWIILSKDDDSVFMISKYCLDIQPFNNSSSIVEWKDSSLRKWLNNDFLNNAFSTKQQERIITANTYDDKQETVVGTEKISCLSVDEIRKYYNVDWDESWKDGKSLAIICNPTQYAIDRGVKHELFTECGYEYHGAYYWLRTESHVGGHYKVYSNGYICPYFDNGDNQENVGVRPCINIKL